MIAMPIDTVSIYNKLIASFSLISDKFEEDLPKFSKDDFLEIFGAEFQKSLTEEGKNAFSTLKQANLSQLQEKLSAAKKSNEKIFNAVVNEYLTNFDFDTAIKNAQIELNKNKETLLKDLTHMLNTTELAFTPKDKDKIKAVFTNHLNDNYSQLNSYLEKIKTQFAPTFAKLQIQLENKPQGNIDFTVESLPGLKELKVPPKPTPKVGWKINKENLKNQLRNDIANGKTDFVIHLIEADTIAMLKQIADIALQNSQNTGMSSAIAIFLTIFLILLKVIVNNKKIVFEALEELVKEGHLSNKDISKLRWEKSTPPTSNEKGGKIIQEKNSLPSEVVENLCTLIDKRNKALSEHHREIQTKKPGSITPSYDSAYNTEDEESDTTSYSRSISP